MGAESQVIDMDILQVDFDLANGLNGVGVQINTAFLADLGNFLDGQNQAGFETRAV
jgi:hypothetical protein